MWSDSPCLPHRLSLRSPPGLKLNMPPWVFLCEPGWPDFEFCGGHNCTHPIPMPVETSSAATGSLLNSCWSCTPETQHRHKALSNSMGWAAAMGELAQP